MRIFRHPSSQSASSLKLDVGGRTLLLASLSEDEFEIWVKVKCYGITWKWIYRTLFWLKTCQSEERGGCTIASIAS